MIDLMLRFEDAAAAIVALPGYRVQGDDGVEAWSLSSHDHALDAIGSVVLVSAEVDPATGEEAVSAVIDERFHVNLRILSGAPPAGLELYMVIPDNPARVWA